MHPLSKLTLLELYIYIYINIYIYNKYIYIVYIEYIYSIYCICRVYICIYIYTLETIKIRYSEFHVNVCYNLQLVHNELTLCLQYNGIYSDRQCKVFWSHAVLKITPKNTVSSIRLTLQVNKTNDTSKQ